MHTVSRRVFRLGLLLSCVAGVCRTAAAQDFTVGVHLQVDGSIRSRVIPAGLMKETERLWGPYAVRLERTDGSCTETAAHGLSLQVILERKAAPGTAGKPTVLGLAPFPVDSPPVQPIRLSFDATRKVLASRPNVHTASVGVVHDHDLARALGRVLAHEIGHVLLNAPFHAEKGLMRAVFRTDELADPDARPFRLTRAGVARLHDRIRVLSEAEHRRPDRTACDIGQGQ